MKYLSIVILLLAACRPTISLQNKHLIYTKTDYKFRGFYADYYLATIGDTVIEYSNRFGAKYNNVSVITDSGNIYTYPYGSTIATQYLVLKREDGFYHYVFFRTYVPLDEYSGEKKWLPVASFSPHKKKPGYFNVAYRERDTTIYVGGYRFRCEKYTRHSSKRVYRKIPRDSAIYFSQKEFHDYPTRGKPGPNDTGYMAVWQDTITEHWYLDKKSYLPIMTKKLCVSDNYTDCDEQYETHVLRYILDNRELPYWRTSKQQRLAKTVPYPSLDEGNIYEWRDWGVYFNMNFRDRKSITYGLFQEADIVIDSALKAKDVKPQDSVFVLIHRRCGPEWEKNYYPVPMFPYVCGIYDLYLTTNQDGPDMARLAYWSDRWLQVGERRFPVLFAPEDFELIRIRKEKSDWMYKIDRSVYDGDWVRGQFTVLSLRVNIHEDKILKYKPSWSDDYFDNLMLQGKLKDTTQQQPGTEKK